MLRTIRTRCPLAIVGVVSFVAASCGSSDGAPTADPSGAGTQGAAITAIGPTAVNGCQLTTAFDLVATSPIGFVGIEELVQDAATANAAATLAQRAELVLWRVDATGQWTQVNQTATAASSSLALVLGITRSSADLSHVQSDTTNDSVRHSDLSTSSTSDISQNTTTALSKQETADTSLWTGDVAAGEMNAINAGRSGRADSAAATNAAQAGTAAANAQNASNAAQAANQATGAASNGAEGTVAHSTAPLVASSWWERGDAIASGNALVWNSLGNLAASHYVIQVKLNAVASDEAVRVFEGTGSTVFASHVFGASFPGCAP